MNLNKIFLRSFLEKLLLEDIYYGDITTDNLLKGDERAKFIVRTKEDLVLCGVDIAIELLKLVNSNVKIEKISEDGEELKKGDIIMEVYGPCRDILIAERTLLNLLQRLSGIASLTRSVVRKLEGSKTKLLDTRKTTPGLRILEKYAVRIGGGYNHRIGLFDGVLIKDNHIAIVGSIRESVRRIKERIPVTVKIEVEVKNLDELMEAISAGCDMALLDNMSIEEIREAVKIAKGTILLEASGNITIDNVEKIASTGVDYISSGFITHHAVWKDINMKVATF
ncbi:MAG: carboxylating nicotinate-nucleotide diphosphorylase [Thermosulfidibacteraceae bacterium]|jgi:nicotinate-nucleotide pyrophosphorylase (carboxylating)